MKSFRRNAKCDEGEEGGLGKLTRANKRGLMGIMRKRRGVRMKYGKRQLLSWRKLADRRRGIRSKRVIRCVAARFTAYPAVATESDYR